MRMSTRSIKMLLLSSLFTTATSFAAVPDPVAEYEPGLGYADLRGNGVDLVEVGSGTTSTTAVVWLGEARVARLLPADAGLKLALGPLLSTDSYSIEMVVAIDDLSGYVKLVDTRNLESDNGLYAVEGRLRYYNAATSEAEVFLPGQLHHVVVTRGADAGYVGYVDGGRQFAFDDDDYHQGTAISIERTLHFLQDDTVTTGEESDATLLSIRLYDTAMTPQQVHELYAGIFRDGFEPRD